MVALQLSDAALVILSTLRQQQQRAVQDGDELGATHAKPVDDAPLLDAALLQELERVLDGRTDAEAEVQADAAGADANEGAGDNQDNQTPQQPSPPHAPLPQGVIGHAVLVRVSAVLEGGESQGTRLDALLAGCTPWFPPRKLFVRSQQLEATLARIRLEQEKREYAEMLRSGSGGGDSQRSGVAAGGGGGGGIDGTATPPYDEAREWKLVRSQLSALANIALSAVAVALAAWWASGNVAVETKLLLSSGATLVIVLAEAFLYSRHLEREQAEEARQRDVIGAKWGARSGKR